jgi:hypothetical protein
VWDKNLLCAREFLVSRKKGCWQQRRKNGRIVRVAATRRSSVRV